MSKGSRSGVEDAFMAELVVELHVPLVAPPGLSDDEYQYPWIMQIEDDVAALDEATDGATDYDDGEELGDDYIFFLTGDDEAKVLAAAKSVASASYVPAGAFLVVNDSQGDMGEGRRVELSAVPTT
jgi:hypothetical protein